MKWILKIIDVQPYKVTCQWNDGLIRTVDLENFLTNFRYKPDSSYYPLLHKPRFLEVRCDGSTLYWENGVTMKDVDGQHKPAPLDIDPDVLFEMTLPSPKSYKNRKKAKIV